jgi:hypothetical protein
MTDKATADLEAATLHLTEVQAQLATAQAAIQTGEGVIAELRAQIEGLNQTIADKDAAAKTFAEERAAEVSAASTELVKVMGEVAAAGETNTKLTVSNQSLSDTIKSKDGEIANLTETIAKLRQEAVDRATLLDNLRVQLTATQAAMAETEAVLAVKSNKLDSTLADHAATVLLMDHTKAKLEDVAQELAKHEAKEALLANLSADNTSLARIHRDLVIYKRKCFNLTQEAHANNVVIDRLSKQIDETEATTRTLLQKQHKQLSEAHAKEMHLLKEMVRSAQQDATNCRIRYQHSGGFTSPKTASHSASTAALLPLPVGLQRSPGTSTSTGSGGVRASSVLSTSTSNGSRGATPSLARTGLASQPRLPSRGNGGFPSLTLDDDHHNRTEFTPSWGSGPESPDMLSSPPTTAHVSNTTTFLPSPNNNASVKSATKAGAPIVLDKLPGSVFPPGRVVEAR